MLFKINGLVLVIFLIFFTTAIAGGQQNGSTLKEEIKALLKDNPEIILDILKENDIAVFDIIEKAVIKKKMQVELQRIQSEIKKPFKPDIDENRPMRGNPDAFITIVVYDDFQCPFCTKGTKLLDQVMEKYKGKVRSFVKHNPLRFHKQAIPAALYFEAVAKQDHEKAWKFHDLLFEKQSSLKDGEKVLKEFAVSLGIDIKKLETDLKGPSIKSIVERDMKEAKKFKFTGTPTFLINGVSLKGAVPEANFSQIIDILLKNQQAIQLEKQE